MSDAKKKFKIQIVNKDRFDRINDWRKAQKLKREQEKEIITKKEERKRDEIERKRLRRIQSKERERTRIKRIKEAEILKKQHEAKKKIMERTFGKEYEKEKQTEFKSKKQSDSAGLNKQTEKEEDPLDAFMKKITSGKEKTKNRKNKNSITKKSNFKNNNNNKLGKPKNTKFLKKGAGEVLENETLYDTSDLVVKERVSWLDKMKAKKKEIRPVDHEKMAYASFRKDFYIEAPEITAMTAEQVEEYRGEELEGVKVRGKNCPRPIVKWSQCGLPDKVYDVLKKFEYSEPFPIQCQAIPCVMSGRDVIACAKTGSGKTLAFVLPMLRHIIDQPALEENEGPIGLVVLPTRELAKQIAQETRKFAAMLGLRVVACHGGKTVADQIAELRRGAEIVVATPGRLIDMLCVNSGRVTNCRRVTYLVLDEADRMFDMGFEPQIMTVIANIREDRQTVLFSATFPKQIEGLVRQIMQRPVEIVIGGRNVASNSVVQKVKILNENEKFNALLKLLGENYNKGQILIFTDRQEAVDALFNDLQKAGYFALSLHGGMDQEDRDCSLTDFRNKTRTILIATSVAARGLDVADLNLVVNYSVPNHYEDYIHRVGRTGRAGRKGYAVTFITQGEARFAPDLLKALTLSKQSGIPPRLVEMAKEFSKKVEKGEEKSTPGVRFSGSKGYQFDETEQYQKQLEKERQQTVYGGSATDEAGKTPQTTAESDLAERVKGSKRLRSYEMSAIDRQLAAAKAGASAIRATISMVNKTHSAQEAQALAKIAYSTVYSEMQNSQTKNSLRSRAEAVAKTLSLSQKLSKLGSGATPQKLAEAINQRKHTKKFVVNDYPQQARFKATNRDSIARVKEFSDVEVTVRGSFFAPGRKPGPGEEKLSLFIEGKTARDVERAYEDLTQIAEEAAEASSGKGGSYGKYQVV